ncbi:TonB-dependent receptor [Gilvimarinus sp. SDUM040013]|uniref:TonB-dependent receptor n=1 Tax=Gilvimarinus gilvus TaxID=3058038 RepID=A0ABU4RYM2_9GAMM|nr:TonB-dependent receptor [Gilvimarinus sp. SDUM040013]MDO3385664.1 TonB-dependent receptor [Gilvimarinus sp. SDUM040013]MDX6849302.1 TonB-dependent receptor [Gilvimarinus sp. SDUM040013]
MTCTAPTFAQVNDEEQETTTLEEVIVTGQRQALENAIDLKRASDTIGDSIVLDEAGKVPSTSLLEILERAPGVTMNRIRAGSEGSPDGFAFEGSGVQVRGLNKTKTLINGREVFSANGGSGLSWADVGPELLKSVTVFKASRADLIEGGVSGTVNLETHMPFDFDGFNANIAIAADYGDYSEEVTPAVSGMISSRFDTDIGEFGVLLDLAYSKIASHDSNIIIPPYHATNYNGERVYAPAGVRHTQDQFERVRDGYYGALQWAPNENLEFFHTTFISERESNRKSQIVSMEPGTSVGVFDGAEFDDGIFVRGAISSTNLESGLAVGTNSSYTPSFSSTADHSTGFKFEQDSWDVSGSYQYVKAESRSGKYSLGSAVIPSIVQTNMDMSGDRPYASLGTPLSTDPGEAGLSRINWLDMSNEGESHALQLDANFDIGDGFFKKLAVGARAADREESDNFVGTWWSATGRNWNGVPRAYANTAPEGDFYLEEFSDFFKGEETPLGGAWIGTRQVNDSAQFDRVYDTYLACGPELHYQCSDPDATTYLYSNEDTLRNRNFDQLPSFYETDHKTQSAYAMFGFANDSDSPLLNFSGNIGVRWVNYDIASEGNFTFNGGSRYYESLAAAEASVEAMGGIDNVAQWQTDNEGMQPPMTLESVGYEKQRLGSFEKDYFLPSLNIKFEPADGWVFRYALTRTLTAPRYPDIRAQGTASIQTTENPINDELDALNPTEDVSIPAIFSGYTNTSGNPFLEPEVSLNHDISLEWYPNRGSTMHLSLFHKSIDNYITFNNFSAPANEYFSPEDYPQSAPVDGGGSEFLDGPVSSRTNFNADEETIIKGFELGGRTYFDSLPGWLSGFGVSANVTFIDNDSPDAFALDINGDKLSVPVIGLSEWAYSTTLLYDYEKFSARLAWNWRDRYLTTTNDSGTTRTYNDPFTGDQIQIGLPVYAADSGRLDASFSYQISDSMNIKLNVQNLTDEDQRTEMEILEGRYVDRAVFVTDRRISLHLGIDF